MPPKRPRLAAEPVRLALTDLEALSRARSYLHDLSVATTPFLFAAATERHREVRAIRSAERGRPVGAIREIIDSPGRAPLDWYGFLAGIASTDARVCVRSRGGEASRARLGGSSEEEQRSFS